MIDFKKHLNKTEIEKKVNPTEIYDTIDRKSITGPLRPAQKIILDNWYSRYKDQRDLIVKLHTGEGKTLIGLLILQSKLNSKEGPCIYVCPNIYLVKQVCEEAQKFGISYCTITENNDIPNEFLCGEKILITNAQKLFNGLTIFRIDSRHIKVGCIILDDSHACIDVIKNSFTVTITKSVNESLYNKFLNLFEEELTEQGEGSILDIKSGSYTTLLPVPYWSWNEKKTEILNLLSEYREDNQIKFVWPLIKDNILNYNCFVTGNKIEISPYYTNIETFGTLASAKQRILMSATTQDDSFFIKGLDFDISAIQNPLIANHQKWSGEKMIIIPSLINDDCDRELVINVFSQKLTNKFGIVAITSSTRKADQYKISGATIADTTNIFEEIDKFKKGNFDKTLVINNRYDGIDLPDEACRILIIDSMPYFDNLYDKYEEKCRPNSDTINKKIAQKIEQGIGRGVRGEKDYCTLLIIGSDIVKFLRSINTNKYFSAQTKKQIEIGMEIANMAKGEMDKGEESIKVVMSLINQCIKRDDGWKEYYSSEMDKIHDEFDDANIYEKLFVETEVEKLNSVGDSEKAILKLQKFIDENNFDNFEKGWYLQNLARYKYNISKVDSNNYQKSAFKLNSQLLKPKEGISYNKINYMNENRLKRIKKYLLRHHDYEELWLAVCAMVDNLSFGIDSDKFEDALREVGELLGFVSQRPDKEIRKGPDNLWCGVDNKYFMFECKNEVEETRVEINKYEAGQMNSHCAWFESEYGKDLEVTRILIIPTKNLSYHADFTHDVGIMKKNKLKELKDNIRAFIKEFSPYNIHEISDEKIQTIIDTHKLNINNLQTLYMEKYYKKTSR